MTDDFSDLTPALLATAHRAGQAIMGHYGTAPDVDLKSDHSPVTAADRDAEEIILSALADLVPEIPVISEEAASEDKVPEVGARFFLVDPLDGTKEFINQRSDFTVNIGLIEGGEPCFGLVYAPARGDVYVTPARGQAMAGTMSAGQGFSQPSLESVRTRAAPAEGLTVVMSRSHLNAETEAVLKPYRVAATAQAGSSLKFCLLATGEADLYPRLARTMEWDTAAGDAVLRAAGGIVLDEAGHPLTYGKRERGFDNPGFIAWGRPPAQT